MKIIPTRVIGGDYLFRWHLLPKNRFLNIYLHKFNRSDDDRALHDHPWHSISILLSGSYREHFQNGFIDRKPLSVFGRKATTAHRIELLTDHAWTLFITGPRIREWGFYCEKGWRHWKLFTNYYSTGDSNEVGPGCD